MGIINLCINSYDATECWLRNYTLYPTGFTDGFLPYGLLAFLAIRKHRDNLNMYNIMLKPIAYDQQLNNPV